MKILAFETAFRECSVALSVDGEVVGYKEAGGYSQQSEKLLALTEELLCEHGLKIDNVDKVAVNVGPGSFTGIRIGVAAARGLKLVLKDLELIGVTSMQVMLAATKERKVMTVIESGQIDYYVQLWERNRNHWVGADIAIITKDSFKNFCEEHADFIVVSNDVTIDNALIAKMNALNLIKIAAELINGQGELHKAEPYYFKPPSISQSKVKK